MTNHDHPLVLLPGLQSDYRAWTRQLEYFSGKVETLVPEGYHDLDSIEAMADHIMGQLPPRFRLVAWSMGGYIAFQLLKELHDRMDCLILIATTPLPENHESTTRRRALIERATSAGIRTAALESLSYSCRDFSRLDRRIQDTLVQSWLDIGLESYCTQQEAIIRRPDARRNLGYATCPTMIVVGEHDRVTPWPAAIDIHAAIPGSQFRMIRNCGHCPPVEAPDEINSLIETWISKQRPAAV